MGTVLAIEKVAPCCVCGYGNPEKVYYSDYRSLSMDKIRIKKRERQLSLYLSNVAAHCQGLPLTRRDCPDQWSTTSGISCVAYRNKAEAFIPSHFRIITSRNLSVNLCNPAYATNNYEQTWNSLMKSLNQSSRNTYATSFAPHLTSSHPIDFSTDIFRIRPRKGAETATCRALLISLEPEMLSDKLTNVKEWLQNAHGIHDKNICLLYGNNESSASEKEMSVFRPPTRNNIQEEFQFLVNESEQGDYVFLYICGDLGLPQQQRDEAIFPCDWTSQGRIVDTDIFTQLIGPMRRGVTVNLFLENKHAVVQLPYAFKPENNGANKPSTTRVNENFSFIRVLEALVQASAGIPGCEVSSFSLRIKHAKVRPDLLFHSG